jgi:ceramide glucosyltransferase
MFPVIVAAFTTLLTLAGVVYYLLAMLAARAYLRRALPRPEFAPPVSLLKPLHGLEPGMAEAFAGHCRQEYAGEYEILFGVHSLDDPAVEAVVQLQEDFPERAIRLVHCPEVLGANGKVSNVAQLIRHARYDYFVINDSDIYVGPRYLARVMAPFAPPSASQAGQPATGLVTALYRGRTHGANGAGGGTVGSKLEALGISTDFIPGVLTARWLDRRLRFGLGSTLAVSRAALEAIGGLETLADYLADDYQLGLRVDAAGFRVELASEVVETTVPAWNFSGFAQHQLRWLRTMRTSRPWGYLGYLMSFGLAWAFLNLIATGFTLPAFALFCLTLLVRLSLAFGVGVGILGDRQVARDVWLLLPRDLIGLGLWAWSYASDTVVWGGTRFAVRQGKLAGANGERQGAPVEPPPTIQN